MKINSTTRGLYQYVPLNQLFPKQEDRDAIFQSNCIRMMLFYHLHELIALNDKNDGAGASTEFIYDQTRSLFGQSVANELHALIKTLCAHQCAIVHDGRITTKYGSWIVRKRNGVVSGARKAALARWGLPKTDRKKKNKPEAQKPIEQPESLYQASGLAEVLEVTPEAVEPTKEVWEITEVIEAGKKKKKAVKVVADKQAGKRKQDEVAMLAYRTIFTDEVLLGVLEAHLEVRRAKKVPNTEGAIKRLAKRIHELSDGDARVAVAIVDKSVRSGWADVFALKEDKQKQSYTDVYEQLRKEYTRQ